MKSIFIGLMSGTSCDAIDAAAIEFHKDGHTLIASLEYKYPEELRQELLQLNQQPSININRLGQLDTAVGKCFAEATNALLNKNNIDAKNISAIGSHGQTIAHQPNSADAFTMQLGCGATIAELTEIPCINDFRSADIAAGGQGAPLAPLFHREAFKNESNIAVVNIGGISNATILSTYPNKQETLGFDTGPGNGLMDEWIFKHKNKSYDHDGEWSKQGTTISSLLDTLLKDPYFHLPHPKSTGRDYFNLQWLTKNLSNTEQTKDIQATLLALTASTVSSSIKQHIDNGEIIVCGGGSKNATLMNALRDYAGEKFIVSTSDQHGIDALWMEAITFAWLAKQRWEKQAIDTGSITGARHPVLMGAIYQNQSLKD